LCCHIQTGGKIKGILFKNPAQSEVFSIVAG
jgi:hypothetical protein